jgi:hypothetical protein
MRLFIYASTYFAIHQCTGAGVEDSSKTLDITPDAKLHFWSEMFPKKLSPTVEIVLSSLWQ